MALPGGPPNTFLSNLIESTFGEEGTSSLNSAPEAWSNMLRRKRDRREKAIPQEHEEVKEPSTPNPEPSNTEGKAKQRKTSSGGRKRVTSGGKEHMEEVKRLLAREREWLERERVTAQLRQKELSRAERSRIERIQSKAMSASRRGSGRRGDKESKNVEARDFIRNIYRGKKNKQKNDDIINYEEMDGFGFPLGNLSGDLVYHIFCFLNISELAACSNTCKPFGAPAEDAIITVFLDIFGQKPDALTRKTLFRILGKAHNSTTKNKTDLFLWSCSRGYIDYVEHVIANGYLKQIRGGINACKSNGFTALHLATEHGYKRIIYLLLQNKADATKTTKDQRSVIHVAAEQGRSSLVKYFVQELSIDVDLRDEAGNTPLVIASAHGHDRAVKALVALEADEGAQNNDGKTPLFAAAESGHITTVRFLLDSASDTTLASGTGKTPLYAAAENGHTEIVELLLQFGADPRQETFRQKTPLYPAAEQGHVQVAKALLKYATVQDLFKLNSYGMTPMIIADKQPSKTVKKLFMAFVYEKGGDGTNKKKLAQMKTPRYLEDLEGLNNVTKPRRKSSARRRRSPSPATTSTKQTSASRRSSERKEAPASRSRVRSARGERKRSNKSPADRSRARSKTPGEASLTSSKTAPRLPVKPRTDVRSLMQRTRTRNDKASETTSNLAVVFSEQQQTSPSKASAPVIAKQLETSVDHIVARTSEHDDTESHGQTMQEIELPVPDVTRQVDRKANTPRAWEATPESKALAAPAHHPPELRVYGAEADEKQLPLADVAPEVSSDEEEKVPPSPHSTDQQERSTADAVRGHGMADADEETPSPKVRARSPLQCATEPVPSFEARLEERRPLTPPAPLSDHDRDSVSDMDDAEAVEEAATDSIARLRLAADRLRGQEEQRQKHRFQLNFKAAQEAEIKAQEADQRKRMAERARQAQPTQPVPAAEEPTQHSSAPDHAKSNPWQRLYKDRTHKARRAHRESKRPKTPPEHVDVQKTVEALQRERELNELQQQRVAEHLARLELKNKAAKQAELKAEEQARRKRRKAREKAKRVAAEIKRREEELRQQELEREHAMIAAAEDERKFQESRTAQRDEFPERPSSEDDAQAVPTSHSQSTLERGRSRLRKGPPKAVFSRLFQDAVRRDDSRQAMHRSDTTDTVYLDEPEMEEAGGSSPSAAWEAPGPDDDLSGLAVMGLQLAVRPVRRTSGPLRSTSSQRLPSISRQRAASQEPLHSSASTSQLRSTRQLSPTVAAREKLRRHSQNVSRNRTPEPRPHPAQIVGSSERKRQLMNRLVHLYTGSSAGRTRRR